MFSPTKLDYSLAIVNNGKMLLSDKVLKFCTIIYKLQLWFTHFLFLILTLIITLTLIPTVTQILTLGPYP